MFVDRFAMRPGHHVQASVGERRFGNCEPDSNLRTIVERKVVGVLMPRLTHRAVILEDELTQEAIEIRAEQIAHDIEHRWILDVLLEERIAMQPEDFADVVLRILRERVGLLLRQYQGVRHSLAGSIQPAYLDDALMHRTADRDRREFADDEESF